MLVFKIKARNSRIYLGNRDTKELHNLKDERSDCRIDDILTLEQAVGFAPDKLKESRISGYVNTCPYCMRE